MKNNFYYLGFKQSKQFFLDKYGKDDTTKALINYFFKQRKDAFYETVVPVVAAGSSAIILAILFNSNNSTDLGIVGLSVGLSLATIMYSSGGILIDGQIRWLRFSRKRLLRFITSYNSGKHLPRKITRKKLFELELEKLK